MKREKRKFTPEERLSILQECEREGQTVTSRKYNLSPSLVQRWKFKYLKQGIEGLKPSYYRIDPKLRELEQENERLKKIIAKQALQIEVQGEVLKHAPVEYLKKKKL